MEETIGNQLINYYNGINKPGKLPAGVELLFPFDQTAVQTAISSFYTKYFNDGDRRTLLVGINPGRLGGGVTGIPFTDPKAMENFLDLPNDFDKKRKLSSQFIYDMIHHLGGPTFFYSKFLISSVCPLGFVKEGKNMNYYDDQKLQNMLESYMVNNLRWHLDNICHDRVIFSLGQGKNLKYLQFLNSKYQLCGEVVALPHPRWILQYRRKRLSEFLDLYKEKLL